MNEIRLKIFLDFSVTFTGNFYSGKIFPLFKSDDLHIYANLIKQVLWN